MRKRNLFYLFVASILTVFLAIGFNACEVDDEAEVDTAGGTADTGGGGSDTGGNTQPPADTNVTPNQCVSGDGDCEGAQCYATDSDCCQPNDGYCDEGCSPADPECSEGCDCDKTSKCTPSCACDADCDDCDCDTNQYCEAAAKHTSETCDCDADCSVGDEACDSDNHCDTYCPSGDDPDC